MSDVEKIERPRLGHSFSGPARTDYGYRISAHTEGRKYVWQVRVNDCREHEMGILATGTAFTVSLAERNAELAVRGLPRICADWPDGYKPSPLNEWQKAAWDMETA